MVRTSIWYELMLMVSSSMTEGGPWRWRRGGSPNIRCIPFPLDDLRLPKEVRDIVSLSSSSTRGGLLFL